MLVKGATVNESLSRCSGIDITNKESTVFGHPTCFFSFIIDVALHTIWVMQFVAIFHLSYFSLHLCMCGYACARDTALIICLCQLCFRGFDNLELLYNKVILSFYLNLLSASILLKTQIENHLGMTGPRWAPCWPHEVCYRGMMIVRRTSKKPITNSMVTRSLTHICFTELMLGVRIFWHCGSI